MSAARNLGIQTSRGENILLLDADNLLSDPEILSELNDTLEKYDTAHFAFRTIVDSWLEYHLVLDSEAPLFANNTVAGWAFKREILGKVQFDDSLEFGEDMDFMDRLSKSGVIHPTLIERVGVRDFPHTFRELMRQKLWYGRTVLNWVRKHHALRDLVVLSPLVAFGLLVSLLPTFFFSLILGVVLTVMFLSIPLALLLRSTTKNIERLTYLIFVRTIYGSFFFTLGFLEGTLQLILKGSRDL